MQQLTERRSVRQFTVSNITDEQIKEILKGGFSAPSAVGKYPVQFIVLKERKDLEKVATIHPYSKFTDKAALCIVVCIIPDQAYESNREHFAVVDGSAACQNIITAGMVQGFSSTWCAVHPNPPVEKAFREWLNIPDNVIPLASISFGKQDPQHKIEHVEKYHEEKVHYNHW